MVKRITPSFDIPGQKKATPSSNDPLFRFYTSLYKQNKNSKIAIKWCLEHGIFSKKKAEKLLMIIEMENLHIKTKKSSG